MIIAPCWRIGRQSNYSPELDLLARKSTLSVLSRTTSQWPFCSSKGQDRNIRNTSTLGLVHPAIVTSATMSWTLCSKRVACSRVSTAPVGPDAALGIDMRARSLVTTSSLRLSNATIAPVSVVHLTLTRRRGAPSALLGRLMLRGARDLTCQMRPVDKVGIASERDVGRRFGRCHRSSWRVGFSKRLVAWQDSSLTRRNMDWTISWTNLLTAAFMRGEVACAYPE